MGVLDVSVALSLFENADSNVGSLELICRTARDCNGRDKAKSKDDLAELPARSLLPTWVSNIHVA